MGYNSSFSITAKLQTLSPGIKDATVDLKHIINVIRENVKEESFIINNQSIDTDSDARWYSAIEDLNKVSATLPGILLTCIRSGEEHGDIECTYHYNGKFHTASMQFSEFDERKLVSTDK